MRIDSGIYPKSDFGLYYRKLVLYIEYRRPLMYFILIQSILGKLPVVPVGNTGTIPHNLCNLFPSIAVFAIIAIK